MLSGVLSLSSRRAGVVVLNRLCVRRASLVRTRSRRRGNESLPRICGNSATRWSHSQSEEEEAAQEAAPPSTNTQQTKAGFNGFGTEHPNGEIKMYYRHKHNHDLDSDKSYQCVIGYDEDGREWWTATFTCPISGQKFPAGTLAEKKSIMVLDKQVYYKRKKEAIHAASARAIDYFQLLEKGKDAPSRLCVEDPMSIEGSSSMETKTSKEMAMSFEPNSSTMSELKTEKDEMEMSLENFSSPHGPNEVEVFAQDTPSPRPLSKKGLGLTDYSAYHDDDTDFTIHHVSGSGATSAPGNKTTMERVMNAWAQTVTAPTVDQHLSRISSTILTTTTLPLPSSWNPLAQRKAAMDDAFKWYKSLKPPGRPRKSSRTGRQKTTFTAATTVPMSVDAGNALLTALAKANQQSYSDDDDVPMSVEPMAKQILNHLWRHSPGKPNADTYNAFIKCLSGTPLEVAQQAEKLLQDMIDGRRAPTGTGILPRPNIETFNTVLQLWCRVAGNQSFGSHVRVFGILEKQENAISANKETFLLLLSRLANGFDKDSVNGFRTFFKKDRAMYWIERATEKNKEWIDTQLFNAPLRWSGGGRTRSCSRPIPWDRHDEIFAMGFKESEKQDDDLVLEARRMEEWLKDMKAQEATPPNIETYESVIQAWIRTGTLDGTLQAESLALEVMSNSDALLPRLQTFHPILAAWVFSGDKLGPTKVEEWIQRLDNLGNTVPQVKPDGRVKALVIKAWLHRQKRVLVEEHKKSSEQDEKKLGDDETKNTPLASFEAAQACSSALESICNELCQGRLQASDPSFFLDGSAFVDVVQAWGNVALESMSRNQSEKESEATFTHHNAITQVLQTVKRLDDTIETYRSMEGDDDVENWNSRQLRHLMCRAPRVYASAVDILNELDRVAAKQDNGGDVSAEGYREGNFSRYLPRAEIMLRRSEEYRVTLSTDLNSTASFEADIDEHDFSSELSDSEQDQMYQFDDSLVLYEDLYSYNSGELKDTMRPTTAYDTMTLYSQIVTGCKKLTLLHEIGDATRLCMLILDFLARRSTSESTQNEIDITDLCSGITSVFGSNIPNAMERAALLTGIGNFAQNVEETTGSSHAKSRKMDKQTRAQHSGETYNVYSPRIVLDRTSLLVELEEFLRDDTSKELIDQSDTTNRTAARAGGKRRRGRRKRRNRRNAKN